MKRLGILLLFAINGLILLSVAFIMSFALYRLFAHAALGEFLVAAAICSLTLLSISKLYAVIANRLEKQ